MRITTSHRPVGAALRATFVGMLATVAVTAACQPGGGGPWGRRGEEPPEEVEEQPTPVVTGRVVQGPITATINAASTIEAELNVTVHAEATGSIVKLMVEEGDDVKEGQLLARIRYDAQSSAVDRAAANLEKTRADYERIKQLFAQGAASAEEMDSARTAYDTAMLDVKDRRRDVRNTRVNAPFSGTITERFVSEGGFVSSGAQLFSIVDFDTLVARVYVPEKELDRIRPGQPVDVVGKAAAGRKAEGKVERIAPIVDATTGTVKVTVALPNDAAKGQTQTFLPGMYAEVTLETERRERATIVAKAAIVREDDVSFVFVVKEDRVERVPVEIGLSAPETVELLQGPPVGTELVFVGHGGLKDGSLIKRVDMSGNPVDGPAAVDGDDAQAAAQAEAAVEPVGGTAAASTKTKKEGA